MSARAFRRLWAATGLSNLGDGVGLVAVPLLAATVTRDPLLIGGVTAMAFLPYLLFAIPVGVLVDRIDRRAAMAAANLARAGLLVALVTGVLADALTIWWIYAVVFVLATAECVYDNAAEGAVAQLVAPDRLDGANSRLQGTMHVANYFLGGPLGALLFTAAAAIPFGVQAGSHALAAVLIAGLPRLAARDPQAGPGPATGARLGGVLADVREGLGWLRRHAVVRNLAVVSAGMAITSEMAQATLVLFALEELDVAPAAYGLFAMAAAVGALGGSVLAPAWSRRLGRTGAMTAGVLVQPFVLLGVGLAPNALAAAALLLLNAGLVGSWNVLSVSLRQQLVPAHLFGRVHGAWRTIVWGGLPVGAWLGGVVASRDGLRAPWLYGAAGFALVAVAAALTLRRAGAVVPGAQPSPSGAAAALSNTGSSAAPW